MLRDGGCPPLCGSAGKIDTRDRWRVVVRGVFLRPICPGGPQAQPQRVVMAHHTMQRLLKQGKFHIRW